MSRIPVLVDVLERTADHRVVGRRHDEHGAARAQDTPVTLPAQGLALRTAAARIVVQVPAVHRDTRILFAEGADATLRLEDGCLTLILRTLHLVETLELGLQAGIAD